METQAMMMLFREQLTNQIPKMRIDLKLESDGQAFAYWYFQKILGIEVDEASDLICDGSGDLGIDAITLSEDKVTFYQFKNVNSHKQMKAGDIDKMLAGLEVIIGQNYSSIANSALKNRINEIYRFTPNKYQIKLVSTGRGNLPPEAIKKLQNFCTTHGGPSKNLFEYSYQNLQDIHDQYYSTNLPTLSESITIETTQTPFMERIGTHEVFLFSLEARQLASLFEEYGERLLQQNVRMFEGEDNPTNLAIEKTATSDEAENFFYYNNGVTIICDTANFNPWTKQIEIGRPQIVNGGQTLRVLHKCARDSNLRPETKVSVRVSTTGGDKDFSCNIAINLNNQTKISNAFLKSNDPLTLQLQHSLSSDGWYLERKFGEINSLMEAEKTELEKNFGNPLTNHVVPFREGMQAYVATVYRDPHFARKNPDDIFADSYFKKVFDDGLTAKNFLFSHILMQQVKKYVEDFKILKRKRYASASERAQSYSRLLNYKILEKEIDDLNECIPMSTIFLASFIYDSHVHSKKVDFAALVEGFKHKPFSMIATPAIKCFLETRSSNTQGSTWTTLMGSNTFLTAAKKKGADENFIQSPTHRTRTDQSASKPDIFMFSGLDDSKVFPFEPCTIGGG